MPPRNEPIKAGTTWSEEENVQLCEAWRFVCHDPITGAEMTVQGMWRAIRKHFATNIPDTIRVQGGLQSHFRDLSRDFTTWKEALGEARKGAKSGYSMADEVHYAQMWFAAKMKNKSFQHHRSWEVVKDCPRFRALPERNIFSSTEDWQTPTEDSPGGTQANFNFEDDSPTPEPVDVPTPDSANVPTTNVDDSPTPIPAYISTPATRPQGKKAAKAGKKQSAHNSALADQLARNAAMRMEEARRREEVRLSERAQDNMWIKRLEEEKAERRREKDERQIMMMDTSYMSPNTKEYWKGERAYIANKRRLFREGQSSNSNDYTPVQETQHSPVQETQHSPVEHHRWC